MSTTFICCNPTGKGIFQVELAREREGNEVDWNCVVVAKDELPFTKFVPTAQLEKQHGVELGQTYMNDHTSTEFIDSIAEVYEEELNEVL